MAIAVVMPKAGITVESCIISQWLVKPGDSVGIGDVLFTYETDKAMFECESTAAGELLAVFFEAGDEAPCLTPVCVVGKKGEDYSDILPSGGAGLPAPEPEIAPEPQRGNAPAAAPSAPREASAGISPRARNLAQRSGVEPSLASGTGPGGRVIERDIRAAMTGLPEKSAEAPSRRIEAEAPAVSRPAAAPSASGGYEDVKFSGIRRVIAKTMHESLQTMAQLTHHHSFDATELQSFRKTLKSRGGDFAGVTIGDMILFAVSRTLLDFADLNANMLSEDTIRRFSSVNLGVAVDTPRGLMVPTLFGAEKMSLIEISKNVKELASNCREGAISPDYLRGGSFTVSNLGASGVELFTPVINPPQTGILGVCGITQRPRMSGAAIELYPAMGLSLTYDHRAIDGAPASRFLSELCKSLQSFTTLLAL